MKPLPQNLARISMGDYHYDLPPGRIASRPLEQRDASRLLVYGTGKIDDAAFADLPHHLEPASLLVLNNTRVVQARLEFFKETGARIEIFCLHPVKPSPDVQLSLGAPSPARWFCLVGNAKKWKEGPLVIRQPDGSFMLEVRMAEARDEGYLLDFRWDPPGTDFAGVLERCGRTPLPPYIKRRAEDSDRQTYQCVFARDEGSVAAPTAGLHFTEGIFHALHRKGIQTDFVTLHVGAATFKPVSASGIAQHEMHREQFVVEKALLQRIIRHRGPLVPVGTTSMRTLESVYWLGAKHWQGEELPGNKLRLEQWAPYQWRGELPSRHQALDALLQWMDREERETLRGETALLIAPGYSFMMADSLLTNFHLPGSTLLLLVSAFIGPDWKDIYRHALNRDYRFLSYGDACLLKGTGR